MPRYLWFILAAIALIIGYNVYGRFVEKIFGPNPKKATPAHTLKMVLTLWQCLSGNCG